MIARFPIEYSLADQLTNFLCLLCVDAFLIFSHLTRSLREPDVPCAKSMEVSESRMERVKTHVLNLTVWRTKIRFEDSLQSLSYVFSPGNFQIIIFKTIV